MARVDEYITNYEANQFCANCNEICSRHCVIWRNALIRYDQEEKAGEEMATSEAALKAQKKYDEAHKEDYTSFHIKMNNDTDAELIAHIKAQKNKNGYFRELVRKDIAGGK